MHTLASMYSTRLSSCVSFSLSWARRERHEVSAYTNMNKLKTQQGRFPTEEGQFMVQIQGHVNIIHFNKLVWSFVSTLKRKKRQPILKRLNTVAVCVFNWHDEQGRHVLHKSSVHYIISLAFSGSQDNLLIECWAHDWKVVSSNPGRSGGRIFFSRVNFACWLLLRVRSTPRVTIVAHKRPQSFCQKCWWQTAPKHAYTL